MSPIATQPSLLLCLPTELRLVLYEAILAPTGTLTLTSTPHKKHAVSPQISPQLLATNHQVYQEARSVLYASNEIIIRLDAHDTVWPTISPTRLSQAVLEKVQHLCLILDCTGNFFVSYGDVDLTALEALVSLKSLRLVVAFDSVALEPADDEEFEGVEVVPGKILPKLGELLTEVLMRVPESARLNFEVDSRSYQYAHLQTTVGARLRGESVSVVDTNVLEATVSLISNELRGIKSGGNPDVFAEYHLELGCNKITSVSRS